MRLKGTLVISHSNADTEGSIVLEIPFQDMPMYPIGTEMSINSTDGVVYLEQVIIQDYYADTKHGTRVSCEDNGLSKLFEAVRNSPACTDEQNGFLTYDGLVDFSNC